MRTNPTRGPYSALLRVGLAIPSRLPGPWWALTPPFHHHRGWRLGPKPVTPRQTLLCGAFPEVAPAGRYPAPLLHGVRTFLGTATFIAAPRSSSHPRNAGLNDAARRVNGGSPQSPRSGVQSGCASKVGTFGSGESQDLRFREKITTCGIRPAASSITPNEIVTCPGIPLLRPKIGLPQRGQNTRVTALPDAA